MKALYAKNAEGQLLMPTVEIGCKVGFNEIVASIMERKKAVGLFSGGLDSTLSALLIKKQGFDVHLVHFVSPFFGCSSEVLSKVRSRVESMGMNLIVHEMGQDYIDKVVKSPKHGFGSAINACIDCHVHMLRITKRIKEEMGAEFVFSGEVLGQRPKSQHKRTLNLVEKESGLLGYLVRPLSAKLLEETEPEKKGILDRDLLMDISGRGRRRQIALAKAFNFSDYPQPAGGCKFTDRNLKSRFNALIKVNKNITWRDLELLKFGRHFLLDNDYYFVVARDEKECVRLSKYLDMGIIIEPANDVPGATGLLISYVGDIEDENDPGIVLAGQIIARYTKAFQLGADTVSIDYFKDGKKLFQKELSPLSEAVLNKHRL